jgi:hypothetical protein
MPAFDGRLTDPVEVPEPIVLVLTQIEAHASQIMELVGDEDSEIYREANEIESKAGYINMVLAGEEI